MLGRKSLLKTRPELHTQTVANTPHKGALSNTYYFYFVLPQNSVVKEIANYNVSKLTANGAPSIDSSPIRIGFFLFNNIVRFDHIENKSTKVDMKVPNGGVVPCISDFSGPITIFYTIEK